MCALPRGVVVLNGAGRFDDSTAETPPPADEVPVVRTWLTSAVDTVSSVVKKAVLYVTFLQTKQPARILSVLQSVR